MIHFQYDEAGACLRGSEVKPKLDRFIISQIASQGKHAKIDDSWWINPKKDDAGRVKQPSLNYKMRFDAGNSKPAHEVVDFPQKTHMIYYPSGIDMIITCYNEELEKAIKDLLPLFFLTHNFGTRQNKGFGSFLLKSNRTVDEQEAELKKHLYISGTNVYYFDIDINNIKTTKNITNYWIIEAIAVFYRDLKSGYNDGKYEYRPSYLMKKYFKLKQFEGKINDKRAMKQKIANTGLFKLKTNSGKGFAYFDNDNNEKEHVQMGGAINDAHYIRGLLGYAQQYTFRDVIYNGTDKKYSDFNVRFTVDGGIIKRFASPILFKPIFTDKNIPNRKARIYLIPDRYMLKKLFMADEKIVDAAANDIISDTVNNEIDDSSINTDAGANNGLSNNAVSGKQKFSDRTVNMTLKVEPKTNRKMSNDEIFVRRREASDLNNTCFKQNKDKMKLKLEYGYGVGFLDDFLEQASIFCECEENTIGFQKLKKSGREIG